MMLSNWTVFALVFALSAALCAFLIRFGRHLRLIDEPSEIKHHTQPTPQAGGVAIVISSLAGLGLLHLLEPTSVRINGYLILSLVWIFLVGLIDDRFSLSPIAKLLLVLVAAVTVVVRLEFSSILLSAAAVLFILFVTNAVNLLDGADGLAGGVMVPILMILGLTFPGFKSNINSLLAILTAAAVAGFLLFNLRGRIFMGDNGSLFLGFMAAVLVLVHSQLGSKGMLFGIVCLAVPIFDTLFVVFRRLRLKLPIFAGDINHSYNVLESKLGSKYAVLAVFYSSTIITLVCAYLLFGEFE